jgi:ferredoxin-nitrite reductase
MNTQEFSEEQKQYLQGFMSGAQLARHSQNSGDVTALMTSATASTAPLAEPAPVHSGPDAPGLIAQDHVMAAGGKLTEQEAAKRKKHPLDQWNDIQLHSAQDRFPKGMDVLAFKYFGLFHTAPTQDSYMTRLRFAGGLMRSDQMRCVAHIAREYAGGYAHITTRANLQIREIRAVYGAEVFTQLQEYGILNKGAGADNIRNITGSPTAGIDAQEIYDTRTLCRDMNHFILNNREMYGLPRKFNISFDGGGRVSTLEDTNDIGFAAVRVGEGKAVAAGVYFRMALGGITGHQDFARDTEVLLTPEQCIPMTAAVVKAFIEEGDRTDRKKARLKYVLDRMGFDGFMQRVQQHLAFEPLRLSLQECEPRPAIDRVAHVGVHPQKQDGLFYIGVVLPVGKLEAEQMFALADLADRYGSGTIRLTAWQNLLISDVQEANVEVLKSELESIGLHWSATNVRAGIVACTGNFGCKFALANTKTTGMEIAAYVEERLQLDTPLNIHVTGCPHSCAQHYIGDVGLLGTKVEVDEEMMDGYHIFVGGGFGADAAIGRQVCSDVLAADAPRVVENMLATYLEKREGEETFVQWTQRHSQEQLQSMFEEKAVVMA